MEPESSLPHSKVPAICPYPEPARTSPCSHLPIREYYLNIILPSTPSSSKCSLSLKLQQIKFFWRLFGAPGLLPSIFEFTFSRYVSPCFSTFQPLFSFPSSRDWDSWWLLKLLMIGVKVQDSLKLTTYYCATCGSPCAFVIVNWCATGLKPGMPLKHLSTTQALVPEALLNHFEGFRSTFPKIGIKFDAHSLFLSLIHRKNRHASRTRVQINACKNCPLHPTYVKLGTQPR